MFVAVSNFIGATSSILTCFAYILFFHTMANAEMPDPPSIREAMIRVYPQYLKNWRLVASLPMFWGIGGFIVGALFVASLYSTTEWF